MSTNLTKKVVFITGASIGIGREDAFLFAKEGCRLALTYNTNKAEAEKVEKKCLELGASEVLTLHLDVRDDREIQDVVAKIIKKFAEISILVNNAGIVVWKPLAKQSFQEIQDQVRINLEALIKVTRTCLPHVKDMIINISSGAGLAGYEDLTTYCATKWAVRGFTKALVKELDAIEVYSINPGVIATQMNDFLGMSPVKVSEVIVNVAKGAYQLENGADVNIWEYVTR